LTQLESAQDDPELLQTARLLALAAAAQRLRQRVVQAAGIRGQFAGLVELLQRQRVVALQQRHLCEVVERGGALAGLAGGLLQLGIGLVELVVSQPGLAEA
jgi:hypothetical protein